MSALLAVALLAPTQILAASGEARVGAPAPWFAGWTAARRVLNRTRVLEAPAAAHVLVLFATWCAPCEVGLRRLAAARARLAAARVRLWLVAVGQGPDQVQPWLAARGLSTVPVLYDRFGRVAQTFGASAEEGGRRLTRLPRTVVLGPQGRVRLLVGAEGPDFLDRLLAAAAAP